jgi:hypothetical protein
MYSKYNLYKVFEYIFGILFFVSIRVFILNTFKKYFTQVWYVLYAVCGMSYITWNIYGGAKS